MSTHNDAPLGGVPSTELVDVGFGIHLNLNTNYQPRCPAAFILDVSGSMEGAPIQELNKALPVLFSELLSNELTAMRVEPCIITCGGEAKVVQPFAPVAAMQELNLQFAASGETPLGRSIRLALTEISKRREHYRAGGLASYRPTVVVLSDGRPTDAEWIQASAELAQLSRDETHPWTVIAVGVGPHADMGALAAITSPALPPQRLHGLQFAALFRWISESLKTGVSRSPALLGSGASQLPPVASWVNPSP